MSHTQLCEMHLYELLEQMIIAFVFCEMDARVHPLLGRYKFIRYVPIV